MLSGEDKKLLVFSGWNDGCRVDVEALQMK